MWEDEKQLLEEGMGKWEVRLAQLRVGKGPEA